MRIIDVDDLKKEQEEDILNHSESLKSHAIEKFFKEFSGTKANRASFVFLRERMIAHLCNSLSEESQEYQEMKSTMMHMNTKEALFRYLEAELFK
jgi:uncharacterized protein YbcI